MISTALLLPIFLICLTIYALHRFVMANGGWGVGWANHADHDHIRHIDG